MNKATNTTEKNKIYCRVQTYKS